MNILMIASEYPPVPGGLANYTYLIAKYLSKNHDLKILRPHRRLIGIMGKVEALKLAKMVICEIKENNNNYDIIHTIPINPYVALIAKYIRSKGYHLVTHGVGLDIYGNSPEYRLARKLLYRYSDKLICGANFQKKIMLKEGCKHEKLSVVIGGVDTDIFRPCVCQDIRTKFNLDSDFIAMSIGRLIKRKGFDIAIKAMSYLRNEDITLVIVGDGPEGSNLVNLINKLSLGKRVKLLGFLPTEDLPKMYSVANVLIAPFRVLGRDLEGFPLVIQESQACGTPVISTTTAGVPELVSNGRSGFLVQPESDIEIAEKIRLLYENKKLLDKMSRCARRFAVERLDYRIIGKKIEQIFSTILEGESHEITKI